MLTNENRDVQFRGRRKSDHQNGDSKRGTKQRFDHALQNLEAFRNLRRALSGAQSRRLGEYVIDVLAEECDSVAWRKMLGEARRRVVLYFPEE